MVKQPWYRNGSVLATTTLLVFNNRFSPVDAFVSPLSLAKRSVYTGKTPISAETGGASDDGGADDGSWYAPPDFAVDDNQLLNVKKASNKPPDFTVDDDDNWTPPKDWTPPPRKQNAPSNMRTSSWMDKNTKFPRSGEDGRSQESRSPRDWGNGNDRPRERRYDSDRPRERGYDNDRPRERRGDSGSFRERRNDGGSFREKRYDSDRPRSRDRGDRGDSRSFRQDFRGTRLFVQGIPPDANWQKLKDHFRIAGEVVFASVSADQNTGESKGFGIVQYETTEMAQNAIKIMRDHPLDGATLYVREDVQEKEGAEMRGAMRQGVEKQSTIPMSWTCADETTTELMSEDDRSVIFSLIRARDDARKRRNFDASDDMREELKSQYNVFLDDRLKLWWVSVDGKRVPSTISDIKGDGGWGALKPWRQIPSTPDNDACVDPDLVFGLLKQRDVARREKDFSTADSLLEEARTSPDNELSLRIHDESRTWRVWTEEAPPREVMYGVQEERASPAEQCLAIVTEHAPEKVDEITMMLEKFPGREYNILKKLTKRYL